ncbi:MAG: hypothetical protein ISS79_07935 [Phycisphaerae bacterium]|nr:hypothetical protein [Phycisphaerae bacterium]
MKTATDSAMCSYKMYWLALAVTFVPAVPVFSLHMTDMPQNMLTKAKEPRERAISLKLPLLQPRFHWTFMSREDFLSGKLVLRIIREGQSNDIVIFENGKLSDGWEAMPITGPRKGEIYFGFTSTRKYLTAPGDKLELELTVTKDLAGIGAMQTGILPAGKHKSRGTYSGLVDKDDISAWAEKLAKEGKKSPAEQEELLNKLRAMVEQRAFLESWKDQWSLKITSEKGWLSDKKATALKAAMRERLSRQTQPPEVSTGSVAAKENLFHKYIWFWVAIPPVALFAAIFFWRAFVKTARKEGIFE